MLFAVVGKSKSNLFISFSLFGVKKNCFPCEWLVFWVTNGEDSVWKGKTLNHSLRSWLKTFPFSTLTSPFLTQKTSHSQGKQFSSLQKEKMKRTKYHLFQGDFIISKIYKHYVVHYIATLSVHTPKGWNLPKMTW